VFEEMDEKKFLVLPGARTITSGWVLVDRREQCVKARIVTQEYKRGGEVHSTTFAATSMLIEQRLVIQRMLESDTSPIRVSTAFYHMLIVEDTVIAASPPTCEERTGKLWRLQKMMPGLRAYPRVIQEHFAKVAEKHGLYRLRSETQLFVDTEAGTLMYVHVDDLMVIGSPQPRRMREDLAKELVIKWGSLTDAQQPEKHPSKLWHCRGVATPAECGSISVDEESLELTQQPAQPYRTAADQLMEIASERPDLAYMVKESASTCSIP